MLNKAQVEKIIKIIKEHVGVAIYHLTGSVPSGVDINRLRSKGIIDDSVPDSAIADAYTLGVLESMDPKILSAPKKDLDILLRTLPALGPVEKSTVEWLKESAALYCKGLGNRIEATTLRIIHDAVKERAMMETIQDTLATATVERKTRGEMVTLLRHATEDMSRDWHRIVNTELHAARTQGLARGIKKQFGDDAYVIVRPHPDCCDLCRAAYLEKDKKPVVFKLSDISSRNNIDMSAAEIRANPGLPPIHPHCYEKTTEIYTKDGFKFISDVTVGELCLSLDPATRNIEWVPVKATVSHFAEKLIRFRTNNFDLAVTPEHQMFYYKGWSYGQGRIVPAFVEAKSLPKSAVIPRTGKWGGNEPESIRIGKLSFSPELFCKFMGWYLSEGCVTKRGPNGFQICISQKKYELDLLIDLSDLPVDKTWKLTNGGIGINDTDLGEYLLPFGKAPEKYVPEEIKNMSPRLIRIFLDTYRKGDGSSRETKGFKGGNFKDERVYCTSSFRMADDLGELMLKAGGHPSYYFNNTYGDVVEHHNGVYQTKTDIWVVRECYSPNAWAEFFSREEIEYRDIAYCVELERNHTLYVRFNGKVTWCGNCQCEVSRIDPLTQEVNAAGQIVFKKK